MTASRRLVRSLAVVVTAGLVALSILVAPSGATEQALQGQGSRSAKSSLAARRVPNVKRMLLTLNQMPTGWVSASSGGGGARLSSNCNFKKIPGKPLAKASATFSDSSGIPVWIEAVGAEPSGKAKPDLSEALRELGGCHSFTLPSSGGVPSVKLTLKRASFPQVGYQSGAFAFLGTLDGIQFTYYFVLARFRDNILSVFAYATLGSSVGPFVKLIDKASAKIEAGL